MKFFILLFVSFTVWASDSPKINQTFLNLIESRSLPEETENGPNCVNTALKLLNYPLDYEYSSPNMILPLLSSDYCKPVFDSPEVGDLFVVLGYNEKKQLVVDHAAVMTKLGEITEKESVNGSFRQYKWRKNYFWNVSFDDQCTMVDYRKNSLVMGCDNSGFVSVLRCEHDYHRGCSASDLDQVKKNRKIIDSFKNQVIFDLEYFYNIERKINVESRLNLNKAQLMLDEARKFLLTFKEKNGCLALEMQKESLLELIDTEIHNVTSFGVFQLK